MPPVSFEKLLHFSFKSVENSLIQNPEPLGSENVRIPGVRPGGWSGLELIDTLHAHQIVYLFAITPLQVLAIQRKKKKKKKKKKKGTVKEHTTKYKATKLRTV